jgi:hypothetical protein
MKTLLLAVCLLGASAAFGQGSFGGSALSNEATPFVMAEHPREAARQRMTVGTDLREDSQITSAQGERPLWEVAPKHKEIPLGDIARDLKKQHDAVKKTDVIWEN